MRPFCTTALAALTTAAVTGGVAVGANQAAAQSATTVQPAAAAAATPVVGDLTGDGIRDVTVLTSTGRPRQAVCSATVRPGLAGGGTGPATVVVLPVIGEPQSGSTQACPDLGVVLAGRTPAQNLLAVTFSRTPRRYAPSIQVFALGPTVARYVDAVAGQTPTTGLGTVDFDGNGTGDLWQSSDQGFSALTHRGASWVSLYRSGPATGLQVQFVDLNHGPGKDIMISTAASAETAPFAAVVDGLSGAVATLADGAAIGGVAVAGYRVGFGTGGDQFLDVVVTPVLTDGTTAARQIFANRSQGGRWSFVRAV